MENLSDEEYSNIEELIYSGNVDNTLIALYMAKNFLNKKDFAYFIYDHSYSIRKYLGFSVYGGKTNQQKIVEENPDIPELNLFYSYAEVNDENIRLMLYHSSLHKYKYNFKNKKIWGNYHVNIAYSDSFMNHFSKNYHKFNRSDILSMTNFCHLYQIIDIYESCKLADILHESDYYWLFDKCKLFSGRDRDKPNDIFFNNIINTMITKNYSESTNWLKFHTFFIESKYIGEDELFEYLKYSSIKRKTLNKVKNYFFNREISLSEIYNRSSAKKSRRTIWMEIIKDNPNRIPKFGKPKRRVNSFTFQDC
jgi:hypothetical protein